MSALIREALELALDLAMAEASNVHEALKGYKPARHAEIDADVDLIRRALDEASVVPAPLSAATYAELEWSSWEPAMRRPSIWTYGWVHSESRDAWADRLRGLKYVPPQLDWSES